MLLVSAFITRCVVSSLLSVCSALCYSVSLSDNTGDKLSDRTRLINTSGNFFHICSNTPQSATQSPSTTQHTARTFPPERNIVCTWAAKKCFSFEPLCPHHLWTRSVALQCPHPSSFAFTSRASSRGSSLNFSEESCELVKCENRCLPQPCEVLSNLWSL